MCFNPFDYVLKHVKCTCIDEFQDDKYGKGVRVHAFGLKKFYGEPGFVCTKCGSLKKAIYNGGWTVEENMG